MQTGKNDKTPNNRRVFKALFGVIIIIVVGMAYGGLIA